MSFKQEKQAYFVLMSIGIGINAIAFLTAGLFLIIASIFLGITKNPVQAIVFGTLFLFIGLLMTWFSVRLFKNKNKL